MKDYRPILFQGEMVKAILSGDKTETRRIIKSPYKWYTDIVFESTYYSNRCYVVAYHKGYATGSKPAECPNSIEIKCPYRAKYLWVKECWKTDITRIQQNHIQYSNRVQFNIEYRADGETKPCLFDGVLNEPAIYKGVDIIKAAKRWNSSLFMRRWLSRITLAVKKIEVERLQDITDKGALAEGFSSVEEFKSLWCKIHGSESWDGNPLVWVIKFSKK